MWIWWEKCEKKESEKDRREWKRKCGRQGREKKGRGIEEELERGRGVKKGIEIERQRTSAERGEKPKEREVSSHKVHLITNPY